MSALIGTEPWLPKISDATRIVMSFVIDASGNCASSFLANSCSPVFKSKTYADSAVSVTVGNAFGGKKSNGTGSGEATAVQQRQLDSELSELQSLKEQVQTGQLSQQDYITYAQPKIDEISQRVGGLTSKNSAWANTINPNWQKFLSSGIVRADNGKWVAA